MKKIKITEKQAQLLGLTKKPLTEGVKNKLKITKEQYDRIFGKAINEAMFSPEVKIKGGESRNDKSFKKSFPTNSDVVNLNPIGEEEEGSPFNIKKRNTLGSPKIPNEIQKFSKPIFENESNTHDELKGLIEVLYGKSTQLSPFWKQNGLTYDKICLELLKNNPALIKSTGDDTYVITKAIGDKDATLKAIEDKLVSIMKPKEEALDEVDAFDELPDNPVNGPSDIPMGVKSNFEVLAFNRDIAILKSKKDGLILFNYGHLTVDDKAGFEEIADMLGKRSKEYIGKYQGAPEFEYGDFDIDEDILSAYVDKNINNLTKGYGVEGLMNGDEIIMTNDELKKELLDLYSNDLNIKKALNSEGLNEEDGLDPVRDRIKRDMASGFVNKLNHDKKSDEEKMDALKRLRAKELERRRKAGELEETSLGGGGAGSGDMGVFGTPSNAPVGKFGEPLKRTFKEGAESNGDVIGQYTTPAFKMKKNHTDFAETKPKAFQKTQWADGGFVEFDDCTKLNNKPAGSGCSAGAVDNVVKIKKTKGNVNAPSLSENKIYETIAKQTGKSINEIKRIIKAKIDKA